MDLPRTRARGRSRRVQVREWLREEADGSLAWAAQLAWGTPSEKDPREDPIGVPQEDPVWKSREDPVEESQKVIKVNRYRWLSPYLMEDGKW